MEALSAEFAVMERLFSSAFEAFVVEISTALTKSLVYFLLTTGPLSNAATEMFPRDPMMLDRMSITELYKEKKSEPENEDGSESEDSSEDEDVDEEDEQDDEDGGEEEDGSDDEESDPVANGNGDAGSGDEDEEDDEDDENDEDDEDDEDEEEEEEEDDEILQPPAKRRK